MPLDEPRLNDLTVFPLPDLESKISRIKNLLADNQYPRSLEFLEHLEMCFGKAPYDLLDQVKRMPNDQELGNQSDLDHILLGIELLAAFENQMGEHFRRSGVDVKWDRVCLGWLIHDIGEMGLKTDVSTTDRVDAQSAPEEEDEYNKGIRLLNILKCKLGALGKSTELVDSAIEMYDAFEQRFVYEAKTCGLPNENRLAHFDIEGVLIRFIDKLDCPIVMRSQRIFQQRIERFTSQEKQRDQWEMNQSEIKNFNFGKLVHTLLGLGAVLDSEGQEALKELIYQELRRSREAGDIDKKTVQQIQASIRRTLKNAAYIPPESIANAIAHCNS